MSSWRLQRGAQVVADRQGAEGNQGREKLVVEFSFWSPYSSSVEVEVFQKCPVSGHLPSSRHSLNKEKEVFRLELSGLVAGALYHYIIENDKSVADPCSRFQPQGIWGPSEIIDPLGYAWKDSAWKGIAPSDQFGKLVIYELHVGTFSQLGTYTDVEAALPQLKDLGITAIELMPLAQCSGNRNWGYDGVLQYSPQHSYGRPEQLKQLIDQAHQLEIAVIIDLVYNHLGPEGNFLPQIAPYLSQKVQTPWGSAINFAGHELSREQRDQVRAYFIENARYWLNEYHIDGFRFDAVQAIVDDSPQQIIAETSCLLRQDAKKLGREILLIAEDETHDGTAVARTNKKQATGSGLGCDYAWNNFYHYSLFASITGQRNSFYSDFGPLSSVAGVLSTASAPSNFRKKAFGGPAILDLTAIPLGKWVAYLQNHDLVGNRGDGQRISSLMASREQRLLAGFLVISSFVPQLFMGEEYGECNPFYYFVDFVDSGLTSRVAKGRASDFKFHGWRQSAPNPGDKRAFIASKLSDWSRLSAKQLSLWHYYRELIAVRKSTGHLLEQVPQVNCQQEQSLLSVCWQSETEALMAVGNFSTTSQNCCLNFRPEKLSEASGWQLVINSASAEFTDEAREGNDPEAGLNEFQGAISIAAKTFMLFKRSLGPNS